MAAWAGCGQIKSAQPDAAIDAASYDAWQVDAPVDAAPPDAAPCNAGDVNVVDPNTGGCYMLFNTAQSWTAASARCAMHSSATHLVTITSAEESVFVFNLAGAGRDVWIGANDTAQSRVWVWENGEPFAYQNWDTGEGQPDNTGEHCVRADGDRGGRWHDDSCGDAWVFVCEHP